MMNQNHFIFARTSKGLDNTEIHPHRLEPRYRRFLELVDGQRTVAELSTVARPHEIPATLDYLLDNGFIEKVGEGPSAELLADDDDPFAAVALTEDMFVEFRARAALQLTEAFGDAAKPAIARLSSAETPQDLRAALRESEGLITDANGPVDPAEVRKIFLRIGRNFV